MPLCPCDSCTWWRWTRSPDFIGPRENLTPVDDIYSPWGCIGPVCQRERKTGRFGARRDTGLCELCTGFIARHPHYDTVIRLEET
jgi:hypothetical protein